MSTSTINHKSLLEQRNKKNGSTTGTTPHNSDVADDQDNQMEKERALRRKVDLRLCTIAGILCSLDLLDSGIISSASVTTMFEDLDLHGNRYSVAIFIFTLSSIAFQAPATIAVRYFGPRIFLASITFAFGLITLCTTFVQTWKEMIVLRVLLGISMAGIYPGLSVLLSAWYRREEQQLRFAFLQSGEVFVLATGNIVNFGLQQLHGRGGLAGWRWMFLVQGLAACLMGIVTFWWIVDFPEKAIHSFKFLDAKETELAVRRIDEDRSDAHPTPFSLKEFLSYAKDIKVYGFCCMLFLLNLVSTGLNYFLPIVLQDGMGFSTNKAILLSAPPYYWAIIPAIFSSWFSDKFRMRGPVIVFNSLCLIIGFVLLGITDQVTVRYIGAFLATGAYVSNWAALTAYYQNNITGQWKRVFTAASVTAFNGAGGIAGSFIFRQQEAPRFQTAVGVCIGSHVLMIGFVAVFSLGFYYSNRKQAQGKHLIENTEGFRHTY